MKTETHSSSAASERIGYGIACAVISMFCIAIMDSCAKLLGAEYAVTQIILARNGVGALAILIFAACASSGLTSLRFRRPVQLALRTLANLATAFLFFSGLRYLPLTDAFSIAFAAPLFITALSVPYLGEEVGVRRWMAVINGFIGVIIVVQPGTASFRVEALYPPGAAFFYATAMLMGRRMTRDMTTSAIMF